MNYYPITEGETSAMFIKKSVQIPDTAVDVAHAVEFITGVDSFATDDSGNPPPIYTEKPECIVSGNWQDYSIIKVPNDVDAGSDIVDENGRYHIKVYIGAAGVTQENGLYLADFVIV
jgi:hypothetical protein